MNNVEKWASVIDHTFKEQKAKDNKLIPNRHTLRYIEIYGNAIQERIQNMKLLTQMAYEGIITYPDAQQMLDNQRVQLEDAIEELENQLWKESGGNV